MPIKLKDGVSKADEYIASLSWGEIIKELREDLNCSAAELKIMLTRSIIKNEIAETLEYFRNDKNEMTGE